MKIELKDITEIIMVCSAIVALRFSNLITFSVEVICIVVHMITKHFSNREKRD